VVAIAGRVADAWNGWGLDVEGSGRRSSGCARRPTGVPVEATWGGIALVGEDRADIDRLLAARAEKGLPVEGVWTGTADELRTFVSALEAAGATGSWSCPPGRPTASM
jgi:hypothetical protein